MRSGRARYVGGYWEDVGSGYQGVGVKQWAETTCPPPTSLFFFKDFIKRKDHKWQAPKIIKTVKTKQEKKAFQTTWDEATSE